jgi:hypothetical protein
MCIYNYVNEPDSEPVQSLFFVKKLQYIRTNLYRRSIMGRLKERIEEIVEIKKQIITVASGGLDAILERIRG